MGRGTLYRQGDVFIQRIGRIPASATRLAHGVLAHGEITGHSHRVEDLSTAVLYAGDPALGEHFVDVTAERARVVHQEHATIALDRGAYRVWRQREYTPSAIVRVAD